MVMNPIAAILFWLGAFMLAKLCKLYVPRFAGTNFIVLVIAMIFLESAALVILANAFHK